MRLIDGKSVSQKVLDECAIEVQNLIDKGVRPGLAVVLVGNDPASKAYVGSKVKLVKEWVFILSKLCFQRKLPRTSFSRLLMI